MKHYSGHSSQKVFKIWWVSYGSKNKKTPGNPNYAIRRIRKNEAEIVRDRIAESMLHNKSRNFWSEIKHIRSNSAGSSKTVDGISDSSSISKSLADKYRELYTCVTVCLTTRVICSVLYRTLIIWSQRRIAQVVIVFMFPISELLLGISNHTKRWMHCSVIRPYC